MRALVLSGGAARGAYEAGVAQALFERERFDIICGTSIGAVNGSLLAQGMVDEVVSVWHSVARLKPIRMSLASLLRGQGFASAQPLRRILEKRLRLDALRCSLVVPATNLMRGTTDSFYRFIGPRADEITAAYTQSGQDAYPLTDDNYLDAVCASAALPFLMPPVHVRVGGEQALYADAALAHNSPLSQAIAAGADDVTVVFMQHAALRYRDYRIRNMMDVLVATQDILQQRMLDLELRLVRATNDMVFAGMAPGKRFIELRVIAPSAPLRIAGMNFRDQEKVDRVFEQGLADGREAIHVREFFAVNNGAKGNEDLAKS